MINHNLPALTQENILKGLNAMQENTKAPAIDSPRIRASKEIEEKIPLLQKLSVEKADDLTHSLLTIACKNDAINEIRILLELNLFPNINQILHLTDEKNDKTHGNGLTLLGLAALNGHFKIVRYLVEEREARINSQDIKGDTPLHQVVYGDSYPFYHWDIDGTSHDKIAQYLIQNGGDLSIKNNEGATPYDKTKWCAPLKIERLLGKRFLTNTGSAIYSADKVRPIFEAHLNIYQPTTISQFFKPIAKPTNSERALVFTIATIMLASNYVLPENDIRTKDAVNVTLGFLIALNILLLTKRIQGDTADSEKTPVLNETPTQANTR